MKQHYRAVRRRRVDQSPSPSSLLDRVACRLGLVIDTSQGPTVASSTRPGIVAPTSGAGQPLEGQARDAVTRPLPARPCLAVSMGSTPRARATELPEELKRRRAAKDEPA
jgi:hypothetical protein